MPLIPLRDILYIIPIEDELVSPTGLLIIPDTAQRKCDQGIVAYRGPMTNLGLPEGERGIQVGDRVLFSPWAGDELLVEGEGRFITLKEEYVLAILNEGEINYIFTLEQVKHAITTAAAEEAGKVKEEEKAVVLRTADHIKQVIADHFQRSLYF